MDKRVKEIFPYLWGEKKKIVGVLVLSFFLIWAFSSYPGGIIQARIGNFTGALEDQPEITEECVGPLKLYLERKELGIGNETALKEKEAISLINKTEKRKFTLVGLGKKTLNYQNQNYTLMLYNTDNKTFVCSANLGKSKICECVENQEFGKASAITELLE